MEVAVTEEKKKIFRAKKTMKMSDRLQLESLHSTLLTTAPRLSNPSPPPLVNGTHKEDGQKGADKEQNNTPDRNSPHAASPSTPTPTSSPAPFLSLNLSPSTASSQSPNDQEEVTSPTSPFHSEFPDLNKTKEVEKKCSSPSQSNESVTSVSSKIKVIPVEGKEEKQNSTEEPAEDSGKDAVLCSSVPSAVSECIEPMDTESDTTNTNDSVASTSAMKDEKPPSVFVASHSSICCSTFPPASGRDLKQTEEIKEDDIKEEDDKPSVETGSKREEKMEVCQIKSEVKKKKKENGETTKPTRPSSTPPSNADKERSSSSGLKRTLSEGNESNELTAKKEGKRPKVEHEELEAQLELKITAKAGSKLKLEKIVQQIVNERLKILELTIFDKHFKELKDRVDKIDCANKHQAAITTLQTKISRLAKKFGEANQASENKKKEEALAAAVKTTTVTNNSQAQRVLLGQTVDLQPEVPREGVGHPLGKTPALSMKKEKEEEEEEMGMEIDMSRHVAMARKLAEYSEGRCRPDIKLRRISTQLESVLYYNCKRGSEIPRPERYASYLFRYLVPYDIYCDWVAKVNYVGLMGKEALPMNLRRTIKRFIEHRFPLLPIEKWREIRDAINELLRVKRKPEFFREYDERISLPF